eukprot:350455_1
MFSYVLLTHIMSLSNVYGNFNCISVKSHVSGTSDDSKIYAVCTSSFPTLVSCGFSTKDNTDADLDGGHMSSTSCAAQNGNHGAGVYAHARCCNFIATNVQCFGFRSESYVQGDDAKQVTTCGEQGYQFLTGCSAFSPWSSIDGSYPGTLSPKSGWITHNRDYQITTQACTAVNAKSSGGVKASISCCNSPTYPFTCVKRFGTPDSTLSLVSCSGQYTMVGCSGFSVYHNINAWYITNDICYARSRSSTNVYAVAICCKIATDNPTPAPTNNPTTYSPTSSPTNTPTINTDPTHAPTSHCPSLIVYILKLDNKNVSISTWDGVYSLDEGNPTFGEIDWVGIDKIKGGWIKYFGNNWVISDINNNVLTHEKIDLNDNYPPIGTYLWNHQSIANGAVVNIKCSQTYSPTPSPTISPTTSPTYSPTTHFVGVFITDNNNNDELYNHWFHREIKTGSDGREYFLYDIYPYRSTLSYDINNGWQLILFNHNIGTTDIYSSNKYGLYPPTNEWILFGNTLQFYIEGLISDWPTNSPSMSPTTLYPTFTPTNIPTISPIMIPTYSPSISPTNSPTLYPTPICNTLIVNLPNGFNDIIAIKIFNSPFVYGGIMNKYYSYWIFDCDNEIDEYTIGCNNGYVAMIYYNGNNIWLISISSSNDDYYKIYSTKSNKYFVPMNAIWIDMSTQIGISQQAYKFNIICGASLNSKPTIKQSIIPTTKISKKK